MEKITNREVVAKLEKYFREQDMKVICKCLANCMLDIHRISVIDHLPELEANHLCYRIRYNSKSIEKFIREGPQGDVNFLTLFEDDVPDKN